ncbi:MAG: glutathione S-transferase family protein [Gammaproteobacteria bacterium]|nr:glutathione S-transferase family protein [Gammaproteobacteria bacterium]
MKLYDFPGAPNPRRVRMFAAEKAIPLESITVDLASTENRRAEFLQKNPSGKIPVLELDDGTCIAESVAICRYLEAIHPDPNLFGTNPVEAALIEMHHRHIELELLSQIGVSWVNGPIVAKLTKGLFEPIPAAKERSDAAVRDYYGRLDGQLANAPYVGGDRFSIADITALIAVDFATAMVDLKPADEHQSLWRWHAGVSARPSASA